MTNISINNNFTFSRNIYNNTSILVTNTTNQKPLIIDFNNSILTGNSTILVKADNVILTNMIVENIDIGDNDFVVLYGSYCFLQNCTFQNINKNFKSLVRLCNTYNTIKILYLDF